MDTSVIGQSRSQKLHECRYQSYTVDITVINIFQKKKKGSYRRQDEDIRK